MVWSFGFAAALIVLLIGGMVGRLADVLSILL